MSWIHRVMEGLVVGVTASLTVALFIELSEARKSLTDATELLRLQLNVNDGLVEEVVALSSRTDDLERRLVLSEQRASRVDPSPASDENVAPTASQPPLNLFLPPQGFEPNRDLTSLRETIQTQRTLSP